MKVLSKPIHEMAEVLHKYGASFRASRKLPLSDHKVMNAIERCRTRDLGGHLDKCSDCDNQRNAYNSCNNRHCPKCQGMNQLKWVDKRAMDLLPIGYFHMVFTIPQELNRLCLMNKKLLYTILFKASAETVTMLTKDQKHLGATPGIISVLHTWGQNLTEHPHVHLIVTAGGVSDRSGKWVNSKKKFFIPVRVLSAVFKGKFLAKLKESYYNGELKLVGSIENLKKENNFKDLLNTVYDKKWVVFAKKPFGNAAHVLKYLGRYTHRIALSNHRIVAMENNTVAFKWKDYADNNKQKVMSLKAHEFIRRFLLHTLPKGFCKIRYYGLSANRNRKNNLRLIRKQLKVPNPVFIKENWQDLLLRLTNFDVYKCPVCKIGKMNTVMVYDRPG